MGIELFALDGRTSAHDDARTFNSANQDNCRFDSPELKTTIQYRTDSKEPFAYERLLKV